MNESILNGAPQQATPQQAPQAPMQEQQMPAGEVPATPEEQEAFDRTVMAGIEVLSDPKLTPKILNQLSDGEPAKALAQTTSQVFGQLDEKSGGTIPEVVIVKAAGDIMLEIAEFGKEAGVIQVDQPTLTKASQYLMMELSDQYEIDPADIQGLSEGMGEDEIQGIVSEQGAAAGDGDPTEQAAPQAPQMQAPAQPQQELPSIINQTVGQ